MATSDATFSCGSCAKRYRLTEAVAGKRLRCSCGAWIDCPPNPPIETDEYDLSPEPQTPPVRAAPVKLTYQQVKRDAFDPDRIKNFQLPLWLLIGGVVVQTITDLIHYRDALIPAMELVSVQLVFGTVTMLVAILAAAKFQGVNLGGFWTAVFKLSAISVAPGAAVSFIAPALSYIPFGSLIGLGIEFCLYFALLGTMFDLDESQTWYVVSVIFIIHVAIYIGLRYTLLAA